MPHDPKAAKAAPTPAPKKVVKPKVKKEEK